MPETTSAVNDQGSFTLFCDGRKHLISAEAFNRYTAYVEDAARQVLVEEGKLFAAPRLVRRDAA